MAFVRRNYRRRPKQNKAMSVTKKPTYVVAREALKTAKSLVRKVETKYFTASYGAVVTANSTGWDQFCMNQIGAGTGDNQRVGLSVNIKELDIHMMFQMSGNIDGGQAVRVVVVQDRQSQPDASLTLSTLFNTTSSDFMTLINYNANAHKRYKILADRIYECDPVNLATTQSGGTTNGTDLLNTQRFHRLVFNKSLLHKLNYNGTATSDFDTNSIYFLITKLNDNSNGSVVTPSIRWLIKYTDE